MRKICSLFLVLAICLSFVPAVYAETLTGEIDLSTSGKICITDTGYITDYGGTYNSSDEMAYTNNYKIIGTIGGDTPIEIRNNSNNDVEYYIWLKDVDIQTDAGCPAISIYNTGTGKIQIYFHLEDSNTIISDGYPPFYVAEGGNVSISLISTSLTYDYTFYNKDSLATDKLFTPGAVDRFDMDGKDFTNIAIDTVNHDCPSKNIYIAAQEHWYYCDHYLYYHSGFHNGGTATCISGAICDVCDTAYTPTDEDNHNWNGWDYVDATTHQNVCLNDASHTETGNHNGGTAYCYIGAYCDDCNTEYTGVDSNNHDWYDWEYIDETTHKRVCWGDLNHFEEGTHDFVDGACDTCGAPNASDYTNVINGDVNITGDSGSEQGITWDTDGNTVTITLDDVVVFGNLILPNNISNELIVINVDSDSRIYGDIMFDNSSYRRDVTIQGNGKLEVSWFTGTGNGDRLNIYTDTEIDGDLFLGASGGMDSHLEIRGATLDVDGAITLIEELHLMEFNDEPAKFIVHGHLLMHNTPVFNIEDNCEIHIMGDGNPSFYVESDTEPSWYQTLLTNKTLPIGYTMQTASDNNNYFSLHDDQGIVETGAVVLKNKPDYNITVVNDDTKSSYTLTTGVYGVNSVYTIEDDTVTLDVSLTSTDYTIGKVIMVVNGVTTDLTEYEPKQYKFTMPAADVKLEIVYKDDGGTTIPGEPPIPQPQPQPEPDYDYDPSYRIEIDKDITNGELKSNKTYATSGERVKLTITPDYGYELSSLKVTRTNGKEIELTRNDDGTYTFRMPSSRVKVTAEFTMNKLYTELCPKDETCPIWPYLDMNPNEWFHDGVHYCIENNIMVGYGDRIFQPNTPISRAMLVTMLWRLEGSPYVNYLMQYKDIEYEVWYTEALRWATSEKLVKGYSSTAFGPNDILTREQMATILWNYAQYKNQDVSVGENTNILSYEDAFDISEWAIPAVQWACGTGILKGDNGYIMPSAPTTRAQTATLFHRFLRI